MHRISVNTYRIKFVRRPQIPLGAMHQPEKGYEIGKNAIIRMIPKLIIGALLLTCFAFALFSCSCFTARGI